MPLAALDRPNVVVRIENGPGPTILLNGHIDTVLADSHCVHDPWLGQREGDRFYGLGACDMKSGVVAAVLATRTLARDTASWSGPLVLTSVVDEEAYSIGAHALFNGRLTADFCVVTESCWDWPCLGSVGKYLVRVDVAGQGAHASWPERGVNAAVEASRFVARLDEIALPTHPRIRSSQCVLSLLSGITKYVITVPDNATILINRHTIPGETEQSVLADYQGLVESLDSRATFILSIDPLRYPAWETSPDNPLVQAFANRYKAEADRNPEYGYTGYGDPNLFSAIAIIPTRRFGPTSGNFHGAGEWVDLPSKAATARPGLSGPGYAPGHPVATHSQWHAMLPLFSARSCRLI